MVSVIKMKVLRKHKSSGATRFKLNPEDVKSLVMEREVNSFLQMIQYPHISFFMDSQVGVGNVAIDCVTLK
jgi:hypothetical protein